MTRFKISSFSELATSNFKTFFPFATLIALAFCNSCHASSAAIFTFRASTTSAIPTCFSSRNS